MEVRELRGLLGAACLGERVDDFSVFECVGPAITWMALTKNSVVIRASFLFLPKPNKPRPGMITTDGLASRSLGESFVAHAS